MQIVVNVENNQFLTFNIPLFLYCTLRLLLVLQFDLNSNVIVSNLVSKYVHVVLDNQFNFYVS